MEMTDEPRFTTVHENLTLSIGEVEKELDVVINAFGHRIVLEITTHTRNDYDIVRIVPQKASGLRIKIGEYRLGEINIRNKDIDYIEFMRPCQLPPEIEDARSRYWKWHKDFSEAMSENDDAKVKELSKIDISELEKEAYPDGKQD